MRNPDDKDKAPGVGAIEFGIIVGVFAVGIVGGYIGYKVGESNVNHQS